MDMDAFIPIGLSIFFLGSLVMAWREIRDARHRIDKLQKENDTLVAENTALKSQAQKPKLGGQIVHRGDAADLIREQERRQKT